MKIKKVICSAGKTGFYFDDQKAIKHGARNDGFALIGKVETDGFKAVRQAGESISVMLILENGQIAQGDCAAVQYSGAGGRDPLFIAEEFIPIIEKYLSPKYEDKEITTFREMAEELEAVQIEGKRLHTAIRYGFTQALLDAVAKANNMLICDVIAKEYNSTVADKPIPIFTQSGDDRHTNADKMIIKEADVLPHALINNVKTKLGEHGEILKEYVAWLRGRILHLRHDKDYNPILHIDVYGTIGELFGESNYEAMADYLSELVELARPFKLQIEGPLDGDNREEVMTNLKNLTALVDERQIPVILVADEWCNTLEDIELFAKEKAGHMIQIKTPDLGGVNNIAEAVTYCKEHGVLAYMGGTCNETDYSARICIQIAMGINPDQVLAKPGMGVDEGYMIVFNEMQRILAVKAALS